MALLTSHVPRSLETKTKLFGFELGDVILVFLFLSLSNLIFGTTRLKIPAVWGGTLLLGVTLRFTKRNKPDHHLEHWGEFQRSPDVFSAAAPDTEYRPYFPR